MALPSGRAEGLRRVASVLSAGREAVAEEGATAETVLWAMWSATRLAAAWQNQALAGGAGSARALSSGPASRPDPVRRPSPVAPSLRPLNATVASPKLAERCAS